MQTSKDRVRCVIVIPPWRVEGDMHILSGSRLTDTLNSRANEFFAVTDAVVFDVASGAEVNRASYMAVNRAAISVVFPVD